MPIQQCRYWFVEKSQLITKLLLPYSAIVNQRYFCMSQFKKVPTTLYESGCHLPFGVYNGLITNTDTSAWDKEGSLFGVRRTQRKAWIFLGVYSPEFICTIAIADAGFFANAFCYYYSFSDGVFDEASTLLPFGFSANFAASLHSDWRIGNYTIITRPDGKLQFSYNGKFYLQITAELTSTGASIIAPSQGGRPFNFTYKNVCLPVEARIENKSKVYTATGNIGAIDFSKGYPPRETIWNWCSLIGKTESGKSIGLNLVKNFNDEIENICWLDGQKTVLGRSFFTLTKPFGRNPWFMGTEDRQLVLRLTPGGIRGANVNLLVMRSYFVQAFGAIEGEWQVDGHIEKFKAYGVAEDHIALW